MSSRARSRASPRTRCRSPDALAGQAGHPPDAGRRRALRPTRPQGIARDVRQAAQVAGVGGPVAGTDPERRGRGDPASSRASEEDRMQFRYQGKSRTLLLKQVEGLVLAASGRNPIRQTRCEIGSSCCRTGSSSRAGGRDLDASIWKVDTAVGPGDEAAGRGGRRDVRFRGGQDDPPVRPHAEQGRRGAVLRPQAPLATGCHPAGRCR